MFLWFPQKQMHCNSKLCTHTLACCLIVLNILFRSWLKPLHKCRLKMKYTSNAEPSPTDRVIIQVFQCCKPVWDSNSSLFYVTSTIFGFIRLNLPLSNFCSVHLLTVSPQFFSITRLVKFTTLIPWALLISCKPPLSILVWKSYFLFLHFNLIKFSAVP